MTLKIEVTIPEEYVSAGRAAGYLERAMQALGYERGGAYEVLADQGPDYAVMKAAAEEAEAAMKAPAQPEAPAEPEVEIRYHGQPGTGRKRRTKEEITLDEEAADLLEDVGLTVTKFNAALDKAGGDWDAVMADLRAAAEAKSPATANISTGEERVDPTEADEADEAEDTGEPLTHDDVRDALGDYAAKFGMPAAQKNGPKLMGADKISAIPDDQAALRKAVGAIRNAIAEG
jgi:hypothetical protein